MLLRASVGMLCLVPIQRRWAIARLAWPGSNSVTLDVEARTPASLPVRRQSESDAAGVMLIEVHAKAAARAGNFAESLMATLRDDLSYEIFDDFLP